MRVSLAACVGVVALTGCATVTAPRGTGDLGVVIERASGQIQLVTTTQPSVLGSVAGLGDLSHASVVYSRDQRYAYVFGRDGGLSKVDILLGRIDKRVVQAGNAIGGAISQDGRLIAVSNYQPGGVRLMPLPISRRPTVTRDAAPKWSAWSTRRGNASCFRSTTREKFGSPI